MVLLLAICVAPSPSRIAAAHGAAGPSWESDPAAVGSLRFYDMRGELITGGRIDDVPFAAYIQASADGRPEDDVASLKVFTPDGSPPSKWHGENLAGPTRYPNPSAPTRVNGAVLPTVTGGARDPSLASYVAAHPSRASGSADIYQVRLYTAHAGDEPSTYSATDIAVNADTWTQVYPDDDSTTITLGITPSSWSPGVSSVSLVSKVTPATVGGTVSFYDGDRLLGALDDRAIQASMSDLALSPGHHVITATFRPRSPTFLGSSATAEYQFGIAAAAAPTSTTMTVNPSGSVEEGTTVTMTATLHPSDAPGSVNFFDGPKVMAAVPLDHGAAAYATTALKASEHHLSASYRPSSDAYESSSSESVALKVAKRKTPVTNDSQSVTVVVPKKTKVKGIKITRNGPLALTGASMIALMALGAAGGVLGVVARAGARRRRREDAQGFS